MAGCPSSNRTHFTRIMKYGKETTQAVDVIKLFYCTVTHVLKVYMPIENSALALILNIVPHLAIYAAFHFSLSSSYASLRWSQI